jgi:hypothetical protein
VASRSHLRALLRAAALASGLSYAMCGVRGPPRPPLAESAVQPAADAGAAPLQLDGGSR